MSSTRLSPLPIRVNHPQRISRGFGSVQYKDSPAIYVVDLLDRLPNVVAIATNALFRTYLVLHPSGTAAPTDDLDDVRHTVGGAAAWDGR